jgi:hypothetical protein
MKKLLILISGLSVGVAYADSKINLDKQTVTCGSYKLNTKSTASDVLKYCNVKKFEEENHIIHKEQEVKFEANTTVKMKCEFTSDKIDECKIDD